MILRQPETVEFDPAKKAHRDAFRAFQKRYAWADSPLRFSPSPLYSNLVDQVKDQLLQWYMAQEAVTQ